eukprot:3839417-Rhodomonas_salina.2
MRASEISAKSVQTMMNGDDDDGSEDDDDDDDNDNDVRHPHQVKSSRPQASAACALSDEASLTSCTGAGVGRSLNNAWRQQIRGQVRASQSNGRGNQVPSHRKRSEHKVPSHATRRDIR